MVIAFGILRRSWATSLGAKKNEKLGDTRLGRSRDRASAHLKKLT